MTLRLASFPAALAVAAFLGCNGPSETPVTPESGAHAAAPSEDRFVPIEEEMAARLEQGKPFEHDADLFDRLYTLTKSGRERYPARIWFLFFDTDLRARIVEDTLKPSKRDQLAFDYLTKVLDPAWSLRVAGVARGQNPELKEKLGLPENCPDPLRAAYEKAREIQGSSAHIEAWRGVTHLFYGSHEESRGVDFAKPAVVMATEFMGGSIEGKDLADVGSGSGPSLPAFRAAIGPTAKLYSVEVDPFVLQVMENVSSGLEVIPIQCENANVKLPPDSVDIIVMTGVHLGSGLDELYEKETLPWLHTMSTALRPGGVLIIDDGNQDLLEEKKDLMRKVERAGFTSLAMRKGKEHPRAESEWIAVFRVDKNAPAPVAPAAAPEASAPSPSPEASPEKAPTPG